MTTPPEEKVIALSRVKLVFLLLMGIGFVLTGLFLLSLDARVIASAPRFNNPDFMYTIGAAAVGFFGPCSVFVIKKLFSKTPGLILNEKGITDRSSGVAAGFIPWTDVLDIREYRVNRQKFVAVYVKDPQKYVKRGNPVTRLANWANLKMAGTPINISAKSLKITYDELFSVIEQFFENSRGG